MRTLALVVALFGGLLLPACGGGGGGGTGGGGTEDEQPLEEPTRALLSTLQGTLPSSGLPDLPRGAVVLQVFDNGDVSFAVAGDPNLTVEATNLRLYRGGPEEEGTEIATLDSGAGLFDGQTRVASGDVRIPEAQAQALAADPEEYFLRVDRSGGQALLRCQLATLQGLTAHAQLSNEALVAAPGPVLFARGGVTVVVESDGTIDVLVGMDERTYGETAGIEDVEEISLIAADPGQGGVNLATLPLGPVTRGVRGAQGEAGLPAVARLLHDRTSVGIVVKVADRATFRDVARGQLTGGSIVLWATPSRWGSEVEGRAVRDLEERAGLTLDFPSFESGSGAFAVAPELGLGRTTAVSIVDREGIAPAPGPAGVVLDLTALLAQGSADSHSAYGDLSVDRELLTHMLARPDEFRVDVDYESDGGGAMRMSASLGQRPVEVFSQLEGSALEFEIDTVQEGRFRYFMADPVAPDVDGARLFDGDPTSGGEVLLDLFGSIQEPAAGNTLEGTVPMPPDGMARMLAAPQQFFVDVHDGPAPLPAGVQASVLQPAEFCGSDYAPPIEGLWSMEAESDYPIEFEYVADSGFTIVHNDETGPAGVPPTCVDFTLQIELREIGASTQTVTYRASGEFGGDSIGFELKALRGDGTVDTASTGVLHDKYFYGEIRFGTIDVASSDDGGAFRLKLQANEFRAVFGGVWVDVEDPDYLLQIHRSVSRGLYEQSLEPTSESLDGPADLKVVEVQRGVRSADLFGVFDGDRVIEVETADRSRALILTFDSANEIRVDIDGDTRSLRRKGS